MTRSGSRQLATLTAALAAAGALSCGRHEAAAVALSADALTRTPWSDVVRAARGTTVRYAMWSGEAARNSFYQGAAADTLSQELGVALTIVPLRDTADLINKLLNEKAAGVTAGSVDIVWINGENFRTAKQGGLLWGPFADALPNIRYFDDEARRRDFGTATDGLEAPVQQAQFVFAYDSARLPQPPATLDALERWVVVHPGRFTYPAIPDFTGSAFIRHVLMHRGGAPPDRFAAPFDAAVYDTASKKALAYLSALTPHLWRRGETFPPTVADLDRLFVNGEIDMTMNYSPTFASEKIARGEFPSTVRTFVLEEGTTANYSFLAIPFNAPNPAGAVAAINHFMSPAHALARARAMGGLFPLRLELLTDEERAGVESLDHGPATLPLPLLESRRIQEADAEYLNRFEREWRTVILER